MNGTRNTSIINTDITHTTITAFHTSQTDDNRILAQIQIKRMGSKIGVNSVATNNDVSVTGPVTSKPFSIQCDDNGRI